MHNDFVQVLVGMRSGDVLIDVNRRFNELMEAVLATGAKGDLKLKLQIKPSKINMGGSVAEVEISHECTIAKPELKVGRSLFFVDPNGSLTRDDPRQSEMFESNEVRNG